MTLGTQIAADDVGLPAVVLRDKNVGAHATDYRSAAVTADDSLDICPTIAAGADCPGRGRHCHFSVE
ncbi:hypothetical protein Acy02nite_51130 [Actinoplanes cyaneus]|uniref:Uncharacterized protein n=1 Tax=Actinoplanes cyaneus TaxID=52696 RepID=A0A919IMV2_9ACTN|nr:hypothetical protein Acy02nite_51130 [Actinoplanes cyaneus]